jgi:hypothetical protein
LFIFFSLVYLTVPSRTFGAVLRQCWYYEPGISYLIVDNQHILLSAASFEDSRERQLANFIPKILFYFHYPAYQDDLLFKTRIEALESYTRNYNGLTHHMSYKVSLDVLDKNVIAYSPNVVKGNYYVRPTTSRRSNFYVHAMNTNTTLNILNTNMTYIGGMTTCSITDTSRENASIDSIEFKLRDIDLVFTTLFSL